MSTQVQFRRGTTTQNNAFTGAIGEISVDTDLKTIRLHDGTTAGGGSTMLNTVSAQTALNKTFSTGSVWQGNAVGLAYGGTGSSLTANAGAVAYSTANGLALSASGTSGQILTSGGLGAPTWVAASSISAGTATVATTATNIAGGSAGQLIIQADTGLSTFITAGATGTFLKSAGAGYAPTWATADITIGTTVTPLGGANTSLAGLNILAATGTSHWLIPVGTTAQRPGSPSIGMIRYNSDQVTFEGYSSGAWSSLGGVTAVNKYTYIRAETSAGAANGDLDFFAQNAGASAAVQVGQWNRTNLKDYTGTLVGTQTTQNVFNTTATTLNIGGAATVLSIGSSTGTTTVNNNLTVTGNLTVNGTTTTINATTLDVVDLNITVAKNASTAAAANGAGLTVAGASATFTYASSDDSWNINKKLNVSGNIVGTLVGTANNIRDYTINQNLGTGNDVTHATITGSGFQTSSDARLKTGIEDSVYGLSEVLQLRSVKYVKAEKTEVGFIAQEIEQILPEFVGENIDGMKTVNYGQMVSVLVKAIQDLSAEVNALKAKLGE